MTMQNSESSPVFYARVAGLLYLTIIICGIYSEVFVRGSLVVMGDAAGTANNILASEGLFRIGFAADILMLLCDVAIAVLFYVLLKPVSKTLALTAAVFRLTQASVLGLNLLNYYSALLVLKGGLYASVFTVDQVQASAMMFLELHSYGYDLGLIFFALSSLILGNLVVRSDYFPSLLGYGLMAAAVVYLVGSLTRFLFPDYASSMEPLYIVPFLAEVSFCLWLLIKGVRVSH